MFRLDDYRVVDATMTGGVARYINHCCEPNCVTETVELADWHIIIFANRRISRGEELSYDYKVMIHPTPLRSDSNKHGLLINLSISVFNQFVHFSLTLRTTTRSRAYVGPKIVESG